MWLFWDGGAGQKIMSESVNGSIVPPMAKLRSSTCGSDDKKALNVADNLEKGTQHYPVDKETTNAQYNMLMNYIVIIRIYVYNYMILECLQ